MPPPSAGALARHTGDEALPAENDVQEKLSSYQKHLSKNQSKDPLSKNSQKKQIQRDIKLSRKGDKKVQKQADNLADVLQSLADNLPELPSVLAINGKHDPHNKVVAALESAASAEEVARRKGLADNLISAFNVQCGYRDLPLAYGPLPKEGLEVLGSAIVRPPKYTAKFLPQEYSLLHKLWSLLGGDCRRAGVIDVGAGNANCAVLAAMLLGLTVVCVERESPRIELRAEVQLPAHRQGKVIRLESDVEDFDTVALAKAAAEHGFDRVVLMAKHPCGIGVDRSIECASRLQAGSIPLVGVVIATCCTNKISCDDFKFSRVPEFCAFYAPKAKCCPPKRPPLESTVELMSRCSAWRNTAGSVGAAILEEQLRWAELFEDSIQRPRLRRLSEVFGASTQVRFAPPECTLQDRCLIAGADPLPSGIWAHGELTADPAFLAQLRTASQALLADSGPIDCRPKGIRSKRYEFDTTGDASDPEPADE